MSFFKWMRSEFSLTLLALPITAAISTSALAMAPSASTNEPAATPRTHPHAIYIDAFGRGGLWGLGYDYQLTDRFAVGATGSFYVLDDQRILSVSPYLSFYPVTRGHHRWLVQAGPQLLHTSTISPVPEWDGMTSNAFSAVAASGYEYRSRFLFRIYGMAAMGGGGVTPWLGISIGGTL